MPTQQQDFYYTRKILSWLFFLAGIGCLIKFFVDGMVNFLWIISAVICFMLAYVISPHQKTDRSDAVELLFDEYIIEMIYYVIVFPLRLIVRGIQHILD